MLQVGDESAGMQVQCPQCTQLIQVSSPAQEVPTAQIPQQPHVVNSQPAGFYGQPQQMPMAQPQVGTVHHTVIMPTKSVGVAILLAVLFGPLGMLYSTVSGGVIMLVVNIIIFLPTLGIGWLVTYPICIIWAAIAANDYNTKIIQRSRQRY